MPEPVRLALISVSGMLLGGITTYRFSRQKIHAEIEKMRAETDKARVETVRLQQPRETAMSCIIGFSTAHAAP